MWVGPRAGLNTMEKKKFSFPCQELNPNHSARSPLLYRLSYSKLCREDRFHNLLRKWYTPNSFHERQSFVCATQQAQCGLQRSMRIQKTLILKGTGPFQWRQHRTASSRQEQESYTRAARIKSASNDQRLAINKYGEIWKVFTVAIMKITAFCDVTRYSLVFCHPKDEGSAFWRFGGTYQTALRHAPEDSYLLIILVKNKINSHRT
jgi:hypothetical protein